MALLALNSRWSVRCIGLKVRVGDSGLQITRGGRWFEVESEDMGEGDGCTVMKTSLFVLPN